MQLTDYEKRAILNTPNRATMTLTEKVNYVVSQMWRVHEYRKMGLSFDKIAEEFHGIVSSDTINKKYRAWEKQQADKSA